MFTRRPLLLKEGEWSDGIWWTAVNFSWMHNRIISYI